MTFKMNRLERLGLECSALLEDFYFWRDRTGYIQLMEQFLNENITGKEFETRFYDMRNLECKRERNWEDFLYIIENFQLSQFKDFSSLISKLFVDCDTFESDPLLREDDDLSEEDLRICVRDILTSINKFYP